MDLQKIRDDIASNMEDARFLAFMMLYTSQEAEAKEELQRIISLQDSILKLLFLRFLTHVPEKKAVKYICQMLEDENLIVVDAAKCAFEKNKCEGRLDALIPLMHSKKSTAQCFAIDVVGREGRLDAVGTLLALMEGADENLLITILTALRYLPSGQSIMSVLDFLVDPREEVRFRAALVCGELYKAETKLLRRSLLSLLKDDSGRIRRAAVWGLRRRLVRGDEKIFMDVGDKDPDPMVRQEAVGGLVAYPTKEVIFQLLQKLISERDRRVSLKCESVLLSMPPQDLVKGLDNVLSHATGEVRHRAILLAAEYQRGSRDYMGFLIKGLGKAKNDKDRLTYLEALGVLGEPDAIPILIEYIHGSPLVAYVAMSSLLRVNPDPGVYLKFLESPKESPLIKQIILRYLVQKPYVAENYKKRMVTYLMTLLQGDNINMRYLAAQVLVHIAGSEAQEALLEAIKIETDPASLNLLRKSLTDFFNDDPKGYVHLLQQNRKDSVLFRELSRLLKGIIWNRSAVLSVLPDMLSSELAMGDDAYIQACIDWLAAQIIQGRVFIEDVLESLETIPNSDEIVVRLSKLLMKHPDVQLVISEKVSRYWLKSKNDEVRAAMVDLMGMASDASSIAALVSVVCSDEFLPLHDNAVRALGRITGASHD